jgi:uncharacterized membrane protein
VFLSCEKEEPAPPEPAGCVAKYSADIAPIVTTKCAISGCHVSGSSFGDFTVYAELKQRADNGRIRKNVFELNTMPPSTQTQLTDAEKDKLKCWLDNGAPQD